VIDTATGLDLAIRIGIPGAGKSTFFAARLTAMPPHVSLDATPAAPAARGSRRSRSSPS